MPLAEKLALNQMKFTVLIVVPLKPELMELVTGGQEFVCGGLHPTVAEQGVGALVGIGVAVAAKLHKLRGEPPGGHADVAAGDDRPVNEARVYPHRPIDG